MPRQNPQILAFNRGIVSPKALARVDLDRIPWSAEIQRNWIPRTLGSMTLRPGWQYLNSTASDNAAYFLPFVFATDDTALIEFTDSLMRVWVDDALVTRPSVTAAITNGGFDSDLTGWTDDDDVGGTSAWVTGGYLGLTGDNTNAARRYQQVTVTETGTEHALNIVIARGPVDFKIGSTLNGSEYMSGTLKTGSHSLAFTPTGDFWIEFCSVLDRIVYVDSVAVASSGVMTITSPYAEADLPLIRSTQSADVIFLACEGYKQKLIERRGETSWSLVDYDAEDGPFDIINTSATNITPSALSGNITLTASAELFTSDIVGALYRLESVGQNVEVDVSAENTFSETIKVTGIGSQRAFAVTRAGTWVGTVTLQRSISAPGDWADVQSWTGNGTINYDDGLDNAVAFYRIGIKTGNYTSGTAELSLSYASGSASGVARVTGFTSSTVVDAEVLDALGSTDATDIWYEGLWSDKRGYPSSVALFEGRMWWAGKNYWYGSVSDGYYSFSLDEEGDAGPIIRVIGFGPVDSINWLLPLHRIMGGTAGSVITARSSSFDEPITPTNFNLKDPDTSGTAKLDALKIDDRGVYVNRSLSRLMDLSYDGGKYSYVSSDLSLLVPEMKIAGIVRIGVQRKPDTRVHCVLADGTVAMLITDPAEDVSAWVTVDSSDPIEDVVVLPGIEEDQVYYVVNRAGGRYLEKWALESECEGGSINKQADSFVISTGQIITGLDHLDTETVVAWGDGKDLGEFTVASNQIDLGASYTDVVVGLKYDARFKSSKMAYAAGMGSALSQRKKITHVAPLLYKTHAQGIKYGTDPNYMDDMPLIEGGAVVDQDSVWDSYDAPSIEVNSSYESDVRLYIDAEAPKPATVLAIIPTIVTHDKS